MTNNLDTVKTKPYHHGALRQALIAAAEASLAEMGVEGFSLREVARRAGVSHGAPAHHFGDARGLLTAVAAHAFEDLIARLEAVAHEPKRAERLKRMAITYAEAEIPALWAFDLVLAIRLRWARPLPLIAGKILDPGLRSSGGARPRPDDPAWAKAAAGAVALAAASALDLAADLGRRADALIAIAPKLRAKPAQIVDLLLDEDCVSPAEAARCAPMTDRAARRLFDRLVTLGAAREVSGRPAFRLYGL